MNRVIKMTTALALGIGVTFGGVAFCGATASAHGVECAYCEIDVAPADVVTMTHAGKVHKYKCIYCALDEAQGEYKSGNVVVTSPSEKKGKPVVIRRVAGKWISPAGATFVGPAKLRHPICHIQYRAFTSRAAAQAHIAKNKKVLGDVKPLSFAQVLKLSS